MCTYEYGVWASIYIFTCTQCTYIEIFILNKYSNIISDIYDANINKRRYHAFAFPCSHTLYTFFRFCIQTKMWWLLGPCGVCFEAKISENLRLLRVGNDGNDCWWYQISSNIVGKPTKMTYHVSFGSRYQLDDTYNSIQWCARRSCRNGGFKIRERPWRYHAIESPCLVTELLLRRLSLDSKILLQIQWIQSRPIRAHACQLGRINK